MILRIEAAPRAAPRLLRRAAAAFVLPADADLPGLDAVAEPPEIPPTDAASPLVPVGAPQLGPPQLGPPQLCAPEARAHAARVLDSLADLQRALLGAPGTDPASARAILGALASRLPSVADPALGTALRAIAVRAAVEGIRQQREP